MSSLPIANNDAFTVSVTDIDVSLDVLKNDIGEGLTLFDAFLDGSSTGLGTVSVSANNTLIYSAVGVGSDTIFYTAQDMFGNEVFGTVFIDIVPPANRAPIANNDSADTDESMPVTIYVLDNDSDPDEQPLTVTNAVVSSGTGQVSINDDNSLTYTPSGAGAELVEITYTVSDGELTSSAIVTVNVTPTGGLNNPPTANDDLAITIKNQAVTINVLENDTDFDGDTLDITGYTLAQGQGDVVVNADKTITFIPSSDFVGHAIIEYTIADSSNATTTASLIVNVNDDVVGDDADNELFGSANANVISGMGGNDSLFGGEGDDRLDGGLGNDYINGELGNDTLYGGDAEEQSVIVGYESVIVGYQNVFVGYQDTITGYHEVLVGFVDVFIGYQDVTVGYEDVIIGYQDVFIGTDETGSPIFESQPIYENRPIIESQAYYRQEEVYESQPIYSSEPVYEDQPVYEDKPIYQTAFVQANDTLIGGAGNDVLEGGRGNDDLAGGSGADVYLFNLGDGQDTINTHDDGGFDSAPSLDRLKLGAGIKSEDLVFSFSGESNQNLVIGIGGTTDSITIENYFDAGHFNQLNAIEFTDGTQLSAAQIAAIMNVAPVLTSTPSTLANGIEDNNYTLQASDLLQGFSDANDDELSVINLTASNGVLIDNQDGTYTFTPTTNFNGNINLNYQVSDGLGGVTEASQSFVIDAVNDAPTVNAVIANQQVDENQALNYTLVSDAFNDIDGDSLSYTATLADGSALPSWLVFDGDKRTFSGTPSFNDAASLSIQVTASDGQLSAAQSFNLLINNVNRAPTGQATATLAKGDQNAVYTVKASDLLQGFTDADGDVLTIANLSADHALVQNNSNGTYTITPETNYSGLVQLSYQVTDSQGGVLFANQSFALTANEIVGTTGADVLQGGTSNDVFVVNHRRDVIIEAVNGGNDTVESTLSYILQANLENLTLKGTANLSGTGNAADNTLMGNMGNNRLLAGDGNDILYGLDGGDTLNGGAGVDSMFGGAGNDTFTVENSGDMVNELINEGFDTVNSFISYTLTANVERLNLEGSENLDGIGNALDNILNGNNANNHLIGGLGDDTLQGKGGADILEGGLGNDLYYVDNVADVVTELAGEGMDKVSSSISYALTANVEQLYLTGIASLSGSGNDLNNIIYGNGGNNLLMGDVGNDSLHGGLGNDTLDGGMGSDTLVGAAGNDTYLFGRNSGYDTINNMDAVGNDILLFDAGVSAHQIWLRQSANDLEVSIIGTANSVKLKNWYTDPSKQLDGLKLAEGNTLLASEVQNLVTAMAAFVPPPMGQTSLDIAQINALDGVIATNWETQVLIT